MAGARGSTHRIIAAAAALAVAATVGMTGGAARAEADGMAFRKKKAPAADSTGSEASPSGGGDSGSAGAAAEEGETRRAADVPQAEDRDRPRDPSLLQKNRADAALAKKKQQEENAPRFYEKWPFWAVTGAVVVGAVLVIFAGPPLIHQINGGDPRACNPNYRGCFP
jgi:hypothetical protein